MGGLTKKGRMKDSVPFPRTSGGNGSPGSSARAVGLATLTYEGIMPMDNETEIRQFVVESLGAMNYDVSDVTGDTDLGPAGLDLESLALAELAVQVEDRFGVSFADTDFERLSLMTLDEFAAEVDSRLAVLASESAD